MSGLRVLQKGARVLLIVDGRLVADMPWQAADQSAAALRSVARLAEEWDQAESIISDQAVLIRSGAPFGLTSNRRLLSEAVKTAANDRDLRRYLPGGIKSREVFGAPSITQLPPRSP